MLAWQNWKLDLPPRWNPVKLDGNYETGAILLADLHRPRLGIRWKKITARRFNPLHWAQRSLRDEVGSLAADEAREFELEGFSSGLLYLEPKPPGRDVFAGFSRVSNRALQIIHHARHRDNTLAQCILPQVRDVPIDEDVPWSIFELGCTVPPGLKLESQQLNAGDLSLAFAGKKQLLAIRQITVAKLALQRMGLEKWLNQQQRRVSRHYRPVGTTEALKLENLAGLRRTLARRRRFFFMRWIPSRLTTFALHDTDRDRLVLLQGTDEPMMRRVALSIGK